MQLIRISLAVLLIVLGRAAWASADPIIVDRGAGGSALTPGVAIDIPLDATGSAYLPDDYAVVLLGGFTFTGQTGTLLTWAGAWMTNIGCGPQHSACPGSLFQFRVFADKGNSPDVTQELGFTNFLQLPSNNDPWTLEKAQLITPIDLVAQTQYWIAVSTIGAASEGAYALALAPGIGTTYGAPDPANHGFFDFVPLVDADMAIYAEGLQAVPEPASLVLVGSGILALYRLRRRPAQPARAIL